MNHRGARGAQPHHKAQHKNGHQVLQRRLKNRRHHNQWISSQRGILHGDRQQSHGKVETSKNERGNHKRAPRGGFFIEKGDEIKRQWGAKGYQRRSGQPEKTAIQTVKTWPAWHFFIPGRRRMNNVLHERKEVAEKDHLHEDRNPTCAYKIQGRNDNGTNNQNKNTRSAQRISEHTRQAAIKALGTPPLRLHLHRHALTPTAAAKL